MTELTVPAYRWKPLLDEEFDTWRERILIQTQRSGGLFRGMHDALAVAAARAHHDREARPWIEAAVELGHAGFMLAEGYVGEALGVPFDDPISGAELASIENWLLAWCLAALLENGRMQAMLIDRPVGTFSKWGPIALKPLHSYLWSVTAGDEVEPPSIPPLEDPSQARYATWPALFSQLTEGTDHVAIERSLDAHAAFAAHRTSRPDILNTVAWVEAGVCRQLGVQVEHPYLPPTLYSEQSA